MKTQFTFRILVGSLLGMIFTIVSASAQDNRTDNHIVTVAIPAVALLDLESSATKNFTATFVAPTEAGDKLAVPTPVATTWLNYSSIQTGTKTKRVEVTTTTLATGVDIKIEAGVAVNTVGAKGTPVVGGITLSTGNQSIIGTIGSAYTLTGYGNGHQLTYSFDTTLDDAKYGDIREGSQQVTVTYTLVDN